MRGVRDQAHGERTTTDRRRVRPLLARASGSVLVEARLARGPMGAISLAAQRFPRPKPVTRAICIERIDAFADKPGLELKRRLYCLERHANQALGVAALVVSV